MRFTVWDEPSKRIKGHGALRYYDPISPKKKLTVRYTSKEQRLKEKHRLETWLQNYVPGKGDPQAIPLVIFDRYLTALLTTEKPRRATTIEMKRKNLTPLLESVFRMEQLTPNFIKSCIANWHTKYKIDTIAIRLRDLRAFLNWCTKEGILEASPMKGIGIPASSFVGRRLNLNELQGLYANLTGNIKDFVTLALETGGRRGDLLQLEFNDVDFDRAYWNLPGKEGKSKSKRDRIIPLSDRALAVLKGRQDKLLGGYVFHGYTKDMLKNDWENVKEAAQIKGRLRIHDLRHTWASFFKGRSDSLKKIAGWTTDQMMGHYRHTEVEELREDMAKSNLGQIFGQIRADVPPNV